MGNIEDFKLGNQNLNLTCFKFGVDHPFWSMIDLSLYSNYILISDRMGFFMNHFIDIRIEYHLCNPFSISQIYKYNSAVVSSALYPAHEHHFLADVLSIQFAAGMSSSHISKCI